MPERLWNRRYVMLLLIEMMMQFGMYLTRPIVSGFAVALGASLAVAGLLSGLNATTSMVMRPITGFLSDVLSKKTVLVFANSFFVVSAIGCALAQSVELVAVFCIVQGVAFAFRTAVLTSMAALSIPSSKVATGIGWLGIAYTLAGAAGPAIGTFVSGAFGYAAVFALSGFLFFVGFLLAVLFKAPPGAQGHRVAPTARVQLENERNSLIAKLKRLIYTPVMPLACIASLLMVAQGTMNSFVILLGNQGEVQGAPLYFLVYSIVVLGARPAAGRVCDKRGLAIVVIPCMTIAITSMVILSLNRSAVAVVVAAAFMGIGQGSAYSSMQAEAVRDVPERKMGRASNTFYIGPDISMGFAPVIGGAIWQTFGVSAMFLFAGLCIAIGLIAFIVLQLTRRPALQGGKN